MRQLAAVVVTVGVIVASCKYCSFARAPLEVSGVLELRSGGMFFPIPRSLLGNVAIGDVLPIRIGAFPDETFLGRVDRFEDPMRVRLISRTDELRDGMPAMVLVAN
jgi:hypothetical protein